MTERVVQRAVSVFLRVGDVESAKPVSGKVPTQLPSLRETDPSPRPPVWANLLGCSDKRGGGRGRG